MANFPSAGYSRPFTCTCDCRYSKLAPRPSPAPSHARTPRLCTASPSDQRSRGGQMDTFKFLLKRGSKVCTAVNGSTVLMEAVDRKKADFIDYLLANAASLGIDINQRDKEGNTALFYAAAGGEVPLLKKLLRAGCPVESDAHERTLLMQAALHGHQEAVQFLVENHVLLCLDLHQKDKDERNALFYCIEGDHLKVLDYLVQNGLMPAADKGGRTNIMQSARTGHLAILRYLLSNAEALTLDVNARDARGENALFYAARSRKVDVVSCLLQFGVAPAASDAGVSVLSQSMCDGCDAVVQALVQQHPAAGDHLAGAMRGHDTKGRTVLHHCVERGDLELLKRLSRFYDAEQDRDLVGATLLMCACKQFDFMHIIRYLVEDLKVDVDKLDGRDRGALFYAVESSNLQATSYLLGHTSRVACDREGLSPLMAATASGDHLVVQALLKSRFARELLNQTDKRGRNEVHYCAIHGYTPILELLHACGSCIDTRDKEGKTPIMYACANGRFHILLSLLRKGADVDALDAQKRNALHYCFGANPSLTCVKILVKYDVDVNQPDVDRLTPLMLSCQTCANAQISIIRYLAENGADPVLQDKDAKDSFDHCPFDAQYVKAFLQDKGEIEFCQRETLDKYRDKLVTVVEFNSVLRGLLREQIFTKTLNFEVMKKPAAERVDRLLELLCQRGAFAFRAFCRVLKAEGESELAYGMLKDAYRKDVEIYW